MLDTDRNIPLWMVLLFSCFTISVDAAENEDTERFQSIPVRFEDDFQKETPGEYSVSGDVEWTKTGLTLKPKASLLRVQQLDAEFQMEIEFDVGEMNKGMQSLSVIRFMFSNQNEFMISITRVHDGRNLRQVVVSKIIRANKQGVLPEVKELVRMAPFTVVGQNETWTMNYDFGVIEIGCNGQKVGNAFSEAFTSWLQAIVVTQAASEISISRLALSGNSCGYSPQQREIFNRINQSRGQAHQEASLGNLQKALELDQSTIALSQRSDGDDAIVQGIFWGSIGARLDDLRRHKESQQAHERAAAIFEQNLGSKHPETLSSKIQACHQELHGRRVDDMAERIDQLVGSYVSIAGRNFRNSQTHLSDLANVRFRQGRECMETQFFPDAERYTGLGVAILAKVLGEDHPTTKLSRSRHDFVSRLSTATGSELERLLEYVRWEIKAEQLKENGTETQVINHRKGILPLVRELFGDVHSTTAFTLSQLSSDRQNEGRFGQALGMELECIDIFRQLYGESSLEYIYARGSLGSQLSMVQRNDEALVLLTEACEQIEKHGFEGKREYASLNLALGRHLTRVDQYRAAVTPLTKSFQLYRSLGLHDSENAIRACERLSNAYMATMQPAKSKFYRDYQRNIVESAHSKESAIFVTVLQADAYHLYLEGNIKEALAKYEQAADLADRLHGKSSRLYEGVILGLIDVHRANGDMTQVAKCYEERLDFELNRRESVFNLYSEMEQFERSTRDLNSLEGLLTLAIDGHLKPERAYNHVIALKGAVTARQRSNHIAKQDPKIERLLDDLKAAEIELAGVSSKPSEKSRPEYLASFARKRQAKKDLFAASSQYQSASKRPNVRDLQQLLHAGTTIVDFVEYNLPTSFPQQSFGTQGNTRIVAFILSENHLKLVDLGSITPITQAWLAWREALDSELEYELKSKEMTLAELTDERGGVVRELLWDPLEQYISATETVVISPSMHLVTCPFAALPSKEGNSFLVEKYAFASIAATRLLPELLGKREEPNSSKMLLVGDIDYDSSPDGVAPESKPVGNGPAHKFFTKLIEPDLELSPIRIAFSSRFQGGNLEELRGGQATELNLRRRVHGTNFLHLNTHGFCLPLHEITRTKKNEISQNDPQRSPWVSGVALAGGNHGMRATESPSSDGILWANEIAELNLQAAELVTLSACQTALGELIPGEGMLGAQRAIHVAGARSSLTTLWSVEARSNAAIMRQFYRKLWNERLPKAKALQQAQILMLRKYRWHRTSSTKNSKLRRRNPPALWAGHVLHGDWQ